MKRIAIVLGLLALSGCATKETIAYEKARYEANPNYADKSNQTTSPYSYTPNDRNYGELFACLLRYSGRFNSRDTLYICQ